MKKISYLTAITAAIVLLTSCSKEKDIVAEPPVQLAEKNLKTVSRTFSTGYSDQTTFSYDAQGRLVNEKEEYTGNIQTRSFDYSTPGKITGTSSENNVLQSSYECTLNSNGYITEMKYKDGAGNLIYTYKFIYDANGYMTRKEWANSAGRTDHFEYKIENGNTIEAKLFYDGVYNYTTVYSYDLSKANSYRHSTGGHWIGNSFGKSSKNLLSNTKTTNAAGAVTWNMNYTNLLDAAGYLAKVNTVNTVNNISIEEIYTFE